MANHIKSKTTGETLEYRELVNMDEQEWTNSICNKLGRLSQGLEKHAGTDKI